MPPENDNVDEKLVEAQCLFWDNPCRPMTVIRRFQDAKAQTEANLKSIAKPLNHNPMDHIREAIGPVVMGLNNQAEYPMLASSICQLCPIYKSKMIEAVGKSVSDFKSILGFRL